MDSVLVLIAAPGSGAIGAEVTGLLSAMGASAPRWLAPGEAAEVDCFARLPDFLAEAAALPLDCAVVAVANRRKRLLVADMDSTMIHQECIDELGIAAGEGQRIGAITARAMRGELDFAQSLRERAALLAGLDGGAIDRILCERITYVPGGDVLIATMKANGAFTALVSGGFRQFTAAVARRLGFDRHEANDLVIENGRLTGAVREPVLGAAAKLEALRRIAMEQGLETSDAIAVGDGANDVPMLMEAGMGVALHAKPHVQESSLICINHGDLTALLYLQGYSKAQFAAPA